MRDWLDKARAHARRIAGEKGVCTIDDVRDVCPPPAGCDPRIMGSVFAGRDFVRVDFRSSGRRACHNRPIGVFRLRENAAQAAVGQG